VSPRIEVGGMGALMHVIDSEGNLIAVWEAVVK
jgi:predicted enzyme related to lactoylglutathione lyase